MNYVKSPVVYVDRITQGLLDYWFFKLPAAFGIGAILQSIDWEAIKPSLWIVVCVFGLVLVDTVTGLMKVFRARGWRGITSTTFRALGWKFIEYGLLSVAFGALDFGFSGSTYTPVTSVLFESAMLYIAITEILSISENLGQLGLVHRILKFARDRDLVEAFSPEKEEEPHNEPAD